MKIAVSATGPSLEDRIEPRFGRCACFLIIETGTLGIEVIENPGRNLGGGAGMEAARKVADQGVSHVLTGRCGPNAEKMLSAAGIRMVEDCEGTVREAVERFRSGSVRAAERTSAGGAAGQNPASAAPTRPTGPDPFGRTGARGSGRGMGGQGGGRRTGGGGGRGTGRRCG
jgi:predicted Fe-Mo cluster-binding NifX family protein